MNILMGPASWSTRLLTSSLRQLTQLHVCRTIPMYGEDDRSSEGDLDASPEIMLQHLFVGLSDKEDW